MKQLDAISARELDALAEENAQIFVQKDRLKTHQLRNVFSAIEKMRTLHKRILRMENGSQKEDMNEELMTQLILLKPKIAYAAGRQRSVRYNFFPFVEQAITAVLDAKEQEKAMKNFFALMESVVGYHKYYENK